MTERKDGTGLEEYLAHLHALADKTIHVHLVGSARTEDPAFDRKVRESLDRLHRRARIAQQ